MIDQKANQRRILIVTYLFPPAGGVMVQRVLKFVKYLPHFHWQPTVLTVRNPDHKMLDRGLLKDVPEQTKILRTVTIEPSKLFHFVRPWFDKTKSAFFKKKTSTDTGGFDPMPKQSLATKISTFIFIPDNRIGWLPFALLSMLRKLRKQKFDMIFSSSPPFSVHLVGLLAKLILKKPWVVDFRDLWVFNPHKKPSTKVHLVISKYVEHQVLGIADKILTVSGPLGEDLKVMYPDVPSGKFEVIPNGYDADDFEMNTHRKRNEKFSIGHIGSLYMASGRTPYYFLLALSHLNKEIPDLAQRMEVFFVGAVDRHNRKIIDRMMSELNLGDILRCVDMVSHSKAISYMREFDVLLFMIGKSVKGCGSSRGCISGKLYEYLAARKPVLALAEKGPIEELMKESRCGVLVDHDDTEKIK